LEVVVDEISSRGLSSTLGLSLSFDLSPPSGLDVDLEYGLVSGGLSDSFPKDG
jgi:hypothetical protein